jgi:hypothetical protein
MRPTGKAAAVHLRTSELLLELMLLLELLLLELLLLGLLLLGLLLLETDHEEWELPTPQRASGRLHRTATNPRGVFSSVFGRIFKKATTDRILSILEFL